MQHIPWSWALQVAIFWEGYACALWRAMRELWESSERGLRELWEGSEMALRGLLSSPSHCFYGLQALTSLFYMANRPVTETTKVDEGYRGIGSARSDCMGNFRQQVDGEWATWATAISNKLSTLALENKEPRSTEANIYFEEASTRCHTSINEIAASGIILGGLKVPEFVKIWKGNWLGHTCHTISIYSMPR